MTLPAIRLRPREPVPSLSSDDPVPMATRALMESVLPIAAHHFGLRTIDLIRPCRQAQLVRARAFVVWALRSLGTPLSYPAIGKLLGNRDHTSMIHLHEKAVRLRLSDAEFRAACARVEAAFQTFQELINGNTRH